MKTSRIFKLFIISISLILLTFILVALLDSFDPYRREIILGITITIALGVGIVGFVMGLIDMKRSRNSKYWIGFIGNTVVLLLFVLLLMYILLNPPEH
jgi:hypothetical protein